MGQKYVTIAEETLAMAGVGVWTVEMDPGKEPRLYADKVMKRLIGSEGEVTAEEDYHKWYAGVVPEFLKPVLQYVQNIVDTGRDQIVYPWDYPDGRRIYIRCGGVRDNEYNGPGVRIRGYHVDITENKQKEEQQQKALLEAYEAAQQANVAKTAFLNNMSHDIRTPMNAILGMTAIASAHIDDKERIKDCLEKINASSKHLLTLINEVLDMSRIESGKVTLESDEFKLPELIENVVTMVRTQIDGHRQKLHVNVLELNHENVRGDTSRIQQVLLNLLENAIKYTRNGGDISFTISEQAAKDNQHGYFTFVIEDNGIGMSPEFLQKIFVPFERAQNVTHSKIQGTGLGMTITRNIVKMMNGDIQVESQENVGSKYTVTIELELCDNVVAPAGKTAEIAECSQQDFTGKTILLVEDNELNADIARELLEMTGAHIEWAEDGKLAVDMIDSVEDGYYDMVLMDIQMPVMNGYEAASAIRALDKKKSAQVPIVALSANAFVEDVQMSLSAGMNEHIAKPIDLKQLMYVMNKWMCN